MRSQLGAHPQPELRNHTLIVTVSSNDGRPVLDRRAYESLARTFHEAAENDEVRVVVLRGLAGCFCLGGDFSEFLDATKQNSMLDAFAADAAILLSLLLQRGAHVGSSAPQGKRRRMVRCGSQAHAFSHSRSVGSRAPAQAA